MGTKPLQNDRSFYPTLSDIRNHIQLAKRAIELSKLDQEQLRLKVEGWKKTNPSAFYFFRPYIHSENLDCNQPVLPSSTTSQANSSEHTPGVFVGDSGSEEAFPLAGSTEKYDQTLLFIHQEEWQKRLLQRYGNNITMIDATYKTTRYDIALFFLCVRTNVGYIVVAEFITQTETAEDIAEALHLLKMNNPNWIPPYFMADYSQAEMVAINTVFPTAKVFLCDFHREQAWLRWTRNGKHKLTRDEGEEVLRLLRACARAPPGESEDIGVYYRKAEDELKKSPVWETHPQVQEWLRQYWLAVPEVHATYVQAFVY